MSTIRVLVGTKKGAFILASDGKRQKWDVAGPFFGGWEMYHLKGSPVDPNRIYASQTSGWFGQIIQRSDDGGKTWFQPGTPAGEPTTMPDGTPKGESNKFAYDTDPPHGKPLTTHQWYDGTQHPWEFKRVWHIEPALDDPDTVYAGAEDAALFKSTDGGQSWRELAGLRGHGTGPQWSPGAGGMGLHTILLDRTNPNRIYIAISAAGAFRTDDGGKNWKPINRGLRSQYIPDPDAEVGHCVHRIAMHPARPDVLYMQKHWDVLRSDNTGDQWHEVSGNLPTDFGFPVEVHAHEPETIYVVPITSDSLHYPPEGKLRVYRSRAGGNEWEPLTKGLPQANCYVNILRDAMSADSLDPCGIYFGTTGGQVYCSADSGDSWSAIVHDLPAVLSVECRNWHDAAAPLHADSIHRYDGGMPIQLVHDRSNTANTIDAQNDWTLTPAQSQTSSNEILKLRLYHAGLEYLYQIVFNIENPALDPRELSAKLPPYCLFEWYAVTAKNYTDLVAALAVQHGFLAPSPNARSAIKSYSAAVLGNVEVFRNKVAAHTAHVLPHSSDNEMDKELSVLPTMPQINGRLHVGGYSIANSRQRSQHNYTWSLSAFHEDFVRRYPKL